MPNFFWWFQLRIYYGVPFLKYLSPHHPGVPLAFLPSSSNSSYSWVLLAILHLPPPTPSSLLHLPPPFS